MKTNFTGKEELRKISKEEVEEILKSDNETTAYGCGSGSGSGDGWYPIGCGCGDGSGSGHSMGLTITNHPYKGIYFSESIMSNNALATQLTELLASSKTLASVLSPFKAGYDNLIINLSDEEKDVAMTMDSGTNTITINRKFVGENGFNYKYKGVDNMGYQHDGTRDGSFSAAFAHEALHAKHYYWYKESMKYGETMEEHVSFLKERGFSDDFIKIFYNNTAEGWEGKTAEEIDRNEHKYFTDYEKEVLNDVRTEYHQRYTNP